MLIAGEVDSFEGKDSLLASRTQFLILAATLRARIGPDELPTTGGVIALWLEF